MGGNLVVKRVLTWLGIAFLIFFIAFNPRDAASVFKAIGSTLWDIGEGFGDFFSDVADSLPRAR